MILVAKIPLFIRLTKRKTKRAKKIWYFDFFFVILCPDEDAILDSGTYERLGQDNGCPGADGCVPA
jgi:hypothetical protein